MHHPRVCDLQLNHERLEVVFDADLTIVAYTADPGTRSAGAFSLLGTRNSPVSGVTHPLSSGGDAVWRVGSP